MATLTLNPQLALQPQLLEGVINQKLEPALYFKDIFNSVNTDKLSITYFQDQISVNSDIDSGVTGLPVTLAELDDLSEIEISPINQQNADMVRSGYKMKFSKRVLREPEFIDEIVRATDRMTYAIADKINNDTINTLSSVNNDLIPAKGFKAWNKDGATPVSDILSFVKASKLPGTPYRMNNLYLHEDNYFELLNYVHSVDINWALNPVQTDEPRIPDIHGVKIHDVGADIAEGSYIGLDSNYPACTVYQYLDPAHSTQKEGAININKYEETKYPYNTVVEMFVERALSIKVPNAVVYCKDAI